MLPSDEKYIELKRKVEDAYKKLQGESLVQNNKNLVDILAKFSSENQTNTDISNNGFHEKIKSSVKPKSNKDLVNGFLSVIGLDESLLLEENQDRDRTYTLYKFIVKNLPILNQALNIVADSVMTPELLDKDVFTVSSAVDPDQILMVENLLSRFKLEEKVAKWINKSLLLGDQFVEIIDTETIEALMQNNVGSNTRLFESIESISTDKFLLESAQSLGYSSIEEVLEVCEFKTLSEDLEVSAFKYMKDSGLNESLTEAKEEEIKGNFDSIYLKTHKPESIVKIQVGEFTLGYLSIETEKSEYLKQTVQNVNQQNSGGGIHYNNPSNTNIAQLETSQEKIINYFYDLVMKKLNSENNNVGEFLKKNSEFSGLISNIVVNKKQTTVRFINPNNMVHWKHRSDDNDVYGQSIFEPMLLLIKHYLAVLTSHTVFNLTRATEKRKITVEVSALDMDAGGSINEVIKKFKQKEHSVMNQINNIDTFATELTAFDDIFLPAIDGQTPIQIDSMQGQSNTLDTEYLELLKSAILNGIYVPKSLLNEVENSYRTSLAQENIMFAMQILSEQKIYQPILNELVHKLLHKVYGVKNSSISVNFNPPTSLMNENIGNTIQQVESITRFITELYTNDGGMGASEPRIDKVKLAKMFFKGLDWGEIEKLAQEKDDKDNLDSLNPNREDDDMMGGMDMGGFDES